MKLNMIDAINLGLQEELARDEKIYLIGEDIGRKGGAFGATKGLQEAFGTDRVMDAPLAESGIVGMALGSAMAGLRPVCEIQFADFIFPAFNQIYSEVSKLRYRTNNDFEAPMVIRAPFGGGIQGGLYHSQSIESFFAHMPGLRVVIPSGPRDAKALLKTSIRSNDPVLFLEHKKAYRSLVEEVGDAEECFPIDQAIMKKQGTDCLIITYGLFVSKALKVAEKLTEEGYSVGVLDLVSIYPLDKATILEAVKVSGKVLLLSEGNKEGNVISEVAAIIAEDILFELDAPIKRLAAPDVPAVPNAKTLEDAYLHFSETLEEETRALILF